MGVSLRCALGLHRWIPFPTAEPDAPRGRRCRRCSRQQVFLVPMRRWIDAVVYYLPAPAAVEATPVETRR